MDNHKINILVIICISIIHGLYCILISKNILKSQTLKDKAKKVFLSMELFQ